jgi:hypothetical protein
MRLDIWEPTMTDFKVLVTEITESMLILKCLLQRLQKAEISSILAISVVQ